MNKTLFSALAVCTVSSLSYASETEGWLGLDSELQSLSSTLTPAQGSAGVGTSGFFRTSLTLADDLVAGGGADIQGFSIDNARLNFNAQVEDWDIMVQFEGSSKVGGIPFVPGVGGVDRILDAYAAWNIQDDIKLTVGQFRPAVLAGSALDENELFFLERSINAAIWSFRDQGVQLSGNFEQFQWWVGLQNGGDGVADDFAYYARAQFNAMGAGTGRVEGAMGADGELDLTVGAAIYVDDSIDDGTAFAVDAKATVDAFSANIEFVNYDEGFSILGAAAADSGVAWNISGTFMFVPDEWEAGIRYEDFDEDVVGGGDLSALTVGVNRYLNGTHNAKVGLNWTEVDDDGGLIGDASIIALGLTLGF